MLESDPLQWWQIYEKYRKKPDEVENNERGVDLDGKDDREMNGKQKKKTLDNELLLERERGIRRREQVGKKEKEKVG